MPAVTADTLSLPRLAQLPESTSRRPVVRVVRTVRTFEGEGFPVRRPFPSPDLPLADPFLLLDHLGAVEYAPGEAKGAPWHPHRGFETVTYIIDGAFEHRDTTGGGGLITDGATQWMTAGAGILHDEMPPEQLVMKGGLFHGIQLWVNLPASLKWTPPRYQPIEAGDVALLSSPDGGTLVRIIAGELDGHKGPGQTWTPITLAHLSVSPGAQVDLPWDPSFNALAYSLAGNGFAGSELRPLPEGQMAVFGDGGAFRVTADRVQDGRGTGNWEVLVLGGRPINEPVARYGPFVMNTRQEILQALEDYQAGRLGTIPPQFMPHRTSADDPELS
ncbi:MAG TPA: pirin family protein [Acidimicrobiales bacterium]|nr:pirin family protein [Acidimicrobiales bacterium]